MRITKYQKSLKTLAVAAAALGALFPAKFAGAVSLDTSNYLPDGEYSLETRENLLLVANGGNAAISAFDTDTYDKNRYHFNIQRNSQGYYTLRSISTGRALDVAGAGTGNGANVQMYQSNGTCAQKWAIQYAESGFYTLKNVCSGKALDVSGGAIRQNGANVQIYTPNGTAAQKWRLIRYGDSDTATRGWRHVLKTGSGKALDVAGGLYFHGSNLQIWDNNNTLAQRFTLVHNADGSLTLESMRNNLVLDVAGGLKINGANVQLWASNGTCAQRWFAVKSGSARVLRNACSGKALDVSGGHISTRGANVQIYTPNGTAAQNWYISGT